VPERVVDVLEPVEVDEQDSDLRPAAARPEQLVVEAASSRARFGSPVSGS
jgi:hypothetical protein